MIIDLSKPRKDYFQNPDVTAILRRFITDKNPITVADLEELDKLGKVVTGTKDASLEQLLKREHQLDSLALVDKIEALTPEQLLVLPPEYRMDTEQARQALVYDTDTLIKLDCAEVKRAILGDKIPRGKLSAARKQAAQWSPEKVIAAAFNYLHEHKEEFAENTFLAYSWFGKDGHRRIVPFYNAIQGAELRAFQNLAAYRLIVPVMRKELRLGKSAESKYEQELTSEQIGRREDKIKRYEKYLQRNRKEGNTIGHYVRGLEVSFDDLIEPVARPFAFHSGRLVRVPSRSRPETFYSIKFTGIPLLELGNPAAYSQVWELRGRCNCADKTYRSDRRRTDLHLGNDEDYFCAHEIAALHTLKSIYDKNTTESIAFLPFLLPTAATMDFVDKLRHQTILLEYNSETGRFSKRALNHTEINKQLGFKCLARSFEQNFTTDVNTFRSMGYDPLNDLVKFR